MYKSYYAIMVVIIGPDRNSGSGGIWAGTGSGPVDLAGTRPVPPFFFRAGL